MPLRHWAGSVCLFVGMNALGFAEGGRGYAAVDGKFT